MKYDKINAVQQLSLTGFTIVEFEAFLPTFKYHWDEYYTHFSGKIKKPRSRGHVTRVFIDTDADVRASEVYSSQRQHGTKKQGRTSSAPIS